MAQSAAKGPVPEAIDLDDPLLTIPLPRYNAMLAVLRNTLYMFVIVFIVGSVTYDIIEIIPDMAASMSVVLENIPSTTFTHFHSISWIDINA